MGAARSTNSEALDHGGRRQFPGQPIGGLLALLAHMPPIPATPAPPRASGVERFLNLFTDVRPGEGTTALLLGLNVFLILMAYYVLKPVREALVLGEGSAELKSYLSAGQVVVLAFIVPLYGRLVARFRRMRLINVVTAAFAACPVIFYVLAQFGVPLAVVFFIWIGIFSLMIISQFWAFANDVYTKEEGERLFVIVGFGASLGAVAGARVVRPVDRTARGLSADAARRGDPRRSVVAHQRHQRTRARPASRGFTDRGQGRA